MQSQHQKSPDCEKTFLVGVGGSGMSTLAKLLISNCIEVSGSDRDYDRGARPEFFQSLMENGITLYPQNGSGIHPELSRIVISTAVESHIPDIVRAKELGIPIIHRSDELSRQLTGHRQIAIAGTSGKSTITGMIGWILAHADLDPTVIGGAPLATGDLIFPATDFAGGHGEWAVFEADESDGSLLRYHPELALIHNITLDHKPLEELVALFQEFARQTHGSLFIPYELTPLFKNLSIQANIVTFGFDVLSDFQATTPIQTEWGMEFASDGEKIKINAPGFHNAINGLAAYAICRSLGLSPHAITTHLSTFPGIQRRFEKICESRGFMIVDDYAHNPDKIAASLKTAQALSKRTIAIFQPHGFGPTRLMFRQLVDVFSSIPRPCDEVILLPIYFAGGAVIQDVSSSLLAEAISCRHSKIRTLDKNSLPAILQTLVQKGDLILVMGARDPSLGQLSRKVAEILTN